MFLTLEPSRWGELAVATYDDQNAAVLFTAAVVKNGGLRLRCRLAAAPDTAATPWEGAKVSTLGTRFIIEQRKADYSATAFGGCRQPLGPHEA